jgi:hypothetical protein
MTNPLFAIKNAVSTLQNANNPAAPASGFTKRDLNLISIRENCGIIAKLICSDAI